MEQVKICLASGLLGFICSIPFQQVIWINASTPWIGVAWLIVVGFFGAILVTWLDPKMSSLSILRLALLYICVAVTFAPSPSQSNGGKSEHWNPAVQMLLIHLYSAAIALVFALFSPFVSSQINRDFANITSNCAILFDEMCDQLRLTKQDSIESDQSLMDISAEQTLLEYDALRRKEEKKVRALEQYLGRRMKVLKTIMNQAQLELWADPVLVHNHEAIYSNLDRLLRDFVQMRLALETGFIPRLSLVLIQPLIPGISLLRDTTREYLSIIEHSLSNMFSPELRLNHRSTKHNMDSLDSISSLRKMPSKSTILIHSGVASDSDTFGHESHVSFEVERKGEVRRDATYQADVAPRRKRTSDHDRTHQIDYHATDSDVSEAESLKNHHSRVHHNDDDDDDIHGTSDLHPRRRDSSSSRTPQKSASQSSFHSTTSTGSLSEKKVAARSNRRQQEEEQHSSSEDEENDDDDDKEDAEKQRRRRRRKERRIQRKHRISISEGLSPYEDHPVSSSERPRDYSTEGTRTSSSEYPTTASDTDHGQHHFGPDDASDHHIQGQSMPSNGDHEEHEERKPYPFIKGPTLIESETLTLSKRTARITQSISREYVDTIKRKISKSELKLSPTAELTRLNFFLWRIAEMRKRLKSLEHAVNFQVRHARVLGEWWSLKATFQSVIVPFFSLFQGLVSVLYMAVALLIRFGLWMLHHCCLRSVRWEDLHWFGRRTQTKVKDPNTGTVTVVATSNPAVSADPSQLPENVARGNINKSSPRQSPRQATQGKQVNQLNQPNQPNQVTQNQLTQGPSSTISSQSSSAASGVNNTATQSSSPSSSNYGRPRTPNNEFISDLELGGSRASFSFAHFDPSQTITSSGPAASSSTPNPSSNGSPHVHFGSPGTRMSSSSTAASMQAPQFNTSFARSSHTSMTNSAAQHHDQLSQSQAVGENIGTPGDEDAPEVRIELPEPSIAKVGHFRIGKGVNLSDRFMHDWIASGGWRFAVRLAVALTVATTGAMAIQLYAFPKIRVAWVCITTLIVFAPELGGTMKRVLHRIAGTIGGAICALISVIFAKYTHRFLIFAPFLIFSFFVTYAQQSAYKPRPYTWTVANFTFALIVMLSWPFNESASEYATLAGYRGLQVLIGCILVVVAAFLVFPVRAEKTLRQKLTLQTQNSVHAFIEMIALTHSAIQETGKITGLVQRTWDLIFPCAQLLKLAKAEKLPLTSNAEKETLINVTKQLENLSDTLVQMHDTLRAGFSPALRDWVSPYCELLTRATLFIEEDALLVYSYLSTGKLEFRPEPTRIPAILQQLDSCYLELRASNPHLAELYPEAFRWNAFMHTAREFIVFFSNLVVYVTEPEQHNQLIHMYSR